MFSNEGSCDDFFNHKQRKKLAPYDLSVSSLFLLFCLQNVSNKNGNVNNMIQSG